MKKCFFYTAVAISTAATGQLNATDIGTSADLIDIITKAEPAERTATLTADISVTAALGEVKGTQLTIDGNGKKICGNGNDGIHSANTASGILNIKDLADFSGFTGYSGGAVYNYSGTVNIDNSTFSNNAAESDGTIFNDSGYLNITDSSFLGNTASVYGGAIGNGNIMNLIASKKDVVFSGNTEKRGGTTAYASDIHNFGTLNLYTAANKTSSFDGGIKGFQDDYATGRGTIGINVKGETPYGVDGTVIFKTGSITNLQDITLGGGALQIENGVTWQKNTLALNGGCLEIGNNSGTLNYEGGSLTLNGDGAIRIDIAAANSYDKIIFSNSARLVISGGKIVVDLGTNYEAALGDSFEIMTDFVWAEGSSLNQLTLELANKPASWNNDYSFKASLGADNRTLSLTVVPEPSLFGALAGLGALALAGTRRRKK